MRLSGILVFLLTGIQAFLFAQHPIVSPDDPAFIAKVASFDFKGQFAARIDQDGTNRYYLADFSMLSTRFERVWFMNLSFGTGKLVNVDPDLRKDRVIFKADKTYDDDLILRVFGELKEQTHRTSVDWSDTQKNEWLSSHDKYQ